MAANLTLKLKTSHKCGLSQLQASLAAAGRWAV